MVRLGFYRHFKGGRYRVIGNAKHSETEEAMVVYQSLDHGTLWVRPQSVWDDPVNRDGYKGPRFVFIAEVDDWEDS